MINYSDRPLGYDKFLEYYTYDLHKEWENNPTKEFEEVARYCYDTYLESFVDSKV